MGTEKTFACMKAAYDAGINFFDTAEGYAGGQSEVVMGKAIKHFGWKQRDLVISTKVPSPAPPSLLISKNANWAGDRSTSAKTTPKTPKTHSTTAAFHANTSPKA